MFTGLVEALGTVQKLERDGAGTNLVLAIPFAPETSLGESIAINGVCLTVIAHDPSTCQFQAGPETLARTNLGELRIGDRVNLERSVRAGDRLGGHWVQGHVDDVGRIDECLPEGEWEVVWFQCSPELTTQMVTKGSIAVDGVSLTLVDVTRDRFSVALIPHTLQHTTLGFKPVGATVNLETDILAKYVAKLLQQQGLISGRTGS